MPVAVVLMLSDDGKMMVGEIDAGMVSPDDLMPVETFEDGVMAAEKLLLGEAEENTEEDAFASAEIPADPAMEQAA